MFKGPNEVTYNLEDDRVQSVTIEDLKFYTTCTLITQYFQFHGCWQMI
jgi:hypothetical protein